MLGLFSANFWQWLFLGSRARLYGLRVIRDSGKPKQHHVAVGESVRVWDIWKAHLLLLYIFFILPLHLTNRRMLSKPRFDLLIIFSISSLLSLSKSGSDSELFLCSIPCPYWSPPSMQSYPPAALHSLCNMEQGWSNICWSGKLRRWLRTVQKAKSWVSIQFCHMICDSFLGSDNK